jgi:hypothetical protein
MILVRTTALLAVIGALGAAGGLAIDARTMLACYLAAAVALVSIPLGALGVMMISYLVRGLWTSDLHAPLSRAALTLPLAGFLFIPVLIGLPWLYPWAGGGVFSGAFQSGYLQPWFFIVRTIAYFTIWSVMAVWAARSYGNDAAMKRSASGGLIVFALTVSWAGIDWIESVEPHFHSSIYGLLFLTFVILSGFAFGMIAVLALGYPQRARLDVYGGILLATLLLWVYNHAMQYIVIWSGDIPDEVTWYLERLAGGWGVALWALYIFQFIVPFFILLPERLRGGRAPLTVLAGGTLALRFLEAIVLIVPAVDIKPWALLLDIPAAILLTVSLWWLAWRAPALRVPKTLRPVAARRYK